jgi:hypothetical protein
MRPYYTRNRIRNLQQERGSGSDCEKLYGSGGSGSGSGSATLFQTSLFGPLFHTLL